MAGIIFHAVLRAGAGRAVVSRVRKAIVIVIGNSFERIVEGLARLLYLSGVSGPSSGTRRRSFTIPLENDKKTYYWVLSRFRSTWTKCLKLRRETFTA
jgi:hypothetical protein